MKSLKYFSLGVACLWAGCTFAQQTGKVYVSGNMKATRVPQTDVTVMDITADINPQTVAVAQSDTAGNFSVDFYADQSRYYKIGGSIFYLSPGDKVGTTLKLMNFGSSFWGNNAALHRYLNKKIPSSFDLFGWEKIPTFDQLKFKIDSVMTARKAELDQLQADTYFKDMEQARICALTAHEYLGYFSVGRLSKWGEDKAVEAQKKKNFHQSIASLVEPLLARVTAKDEYLDLPEVRNVLKECVEVGILTFKHSALFDEYMVACEKKQFMNSKGITQDEYDRLAVAIGGMTAPNLQKALRECLEMKANLLQGKKAVDIELEDFDGKKLHLSDLKGKPLYVDIWATWCIPCLAQMPHFEELNKLYPDIQFVGISIDMDAKAWRSKLSKDGVPEGIKEYLANPYKVGESWDVQSIPRFLVIDKDFNIVSSAAPRPSDADNIKQILNQLLQ